MGEAPAPEILTRLKIAYTTHDLILLLIEKQAFEQIMPEVRKLLDLQLPVKYEEGLTKSLVTIASRLAEAKQFPLAHATLTEGYERLKKVQNRADVLRFEAYVYKEEGNLDMAIEMYQRANALQERP